MSEGMTPGSFTNTILAIIGLMATAIATLWKAAERKNAKAISKLEQRADSCERDREAMRDEIVALKARVNGKDSRDDG